jgi:glycosyltransferase involved in cell wall biosynthesis
MKTSPKVSVVLPVYNSAAHLAEAVRSILTQTFRDFECMIINDGSTDQSAEIVRSFRDSRMVLVDNLANSGLVAALNQGLDLARGEYVARMDADDIALPERLVGFMDAHPEVGVLGTWFQSFGTHDYVCRHPRRVRYLDLLAGCAIGHSTVMLRKAAFDRHRLRYDPAYEACEDYELWARAICHMELANLPEVLLRYRCHDQNITVVKKRLMTENTRRVRRRLLAFLTDDAGAGRRIDRLVGGQRLFTKSVSLRLWEWVGSRQGADWYFFHVPLFRIRRDEAWTRYWILGIRVCKKRTTIS